MPSINLDIIVNAIDNASAGLKNIVGGIDKTKMAGAAMSAAGAAIVGTFAAVTMKSAEAGDAMKVASQKTQTTAENLSSLKYAGEMAGLSFDTLQGGLVKMNKAIAASPEKFTQLGISLTNADGSARDSTAVFQDMADKIMAIPDGASRTAVAMDIFGKSGAAMLPLFMEGTAGIQQMRTEAESLGFTMTTDGVNAADNFGYALDTLKMTLGGFGQTIAQFVMPVLTPMIDVITNVLKKIVAWTKAHQALTRNILLVVGALGVLLATVGPILLVIQTISSAFAIFSGVTLASCSSFLIWTGIVLAAISAIVLWWKNINIAKEALGHLSDAKAKDRATEAGYAYLKAKKDKNVSPEEKQRLKEQWDEAVEARDRVLNKNSKARGDESINVENSIKSIQIKLGDAVKSVTAAKAESAQIESTTTKPIDTKAQKATLDKMVTDQNAKLSKEINSQQNWEDSIDNGTTSSQKERTNYQQAQQIITQTPQSQLAQTATNLHNGYQKMTGLSLTLPESTTQMIPQPNIVMPPTSTTTTLHRFEITLKTDGSMVVNPAQIEDIALKVVNGTIKQQEWVKRY